MTVYTHNPFGGMRNPTPYGGGMAGGLMNRPPPFMPQQPMPQMPMDETIYTPRMPQGPQGPRMPQFPIPQMPRRMPGGPSKGGNTTPPPIQGPMRGPQMPMPRPPMQRPGGPGKARTGPRGGLMRRGRGSLMRGGPGKGRGQPQMPMPQPNVGQIGFSSRPSFDQLMTEGPMSMPRPMPRPAPFMGEVGQAFTQGPTSIPNLRQQMGFYGGGITDLY